MVEMTGKELAKSAGVKEMNRCPKNIKTIWAQEETVGQQQRTVHKTG